MSQPAPFEITTDERLTVASNGTQRVIGYREEGARLWRRRAITGIATQAAAERLIPQLNAFLGELLGDLEMPAQAAVHKLVAIAGTVPTAPPQNLEWCVAELDGVRCYCDGVNVILTRKDLTP